MSGVLLAPDLLAARGPSGLRRRQRPCGYSAFLKRVQAGEELQVTSRGRIIARIAPERDPADEARQWLRDANHL